AALRVRLAGPEAVRRLGPARGLGGAGHAVAAVDGAHRQRDGAHADALGLFALANVAVGAAGDRAARNQRHAHRIRVAFVDQAVTVVVLAVAPLHRPRVGVGVAVVAVHSGIPTVLISVHRAGLLLRGAVLGRPCAARDRRAWINRRI